MSKYKPGSIGTFTGKTGQVVTYRSLGMALGRATPKKTTKITTVPIKNQRTKMGLTSKFLSRIKEVIAVGFPSKRDNKVEMSDAIKNNIKTAISGIYPDLSIDYAKIQLSKGWLDQIYTPSMTKNEDGSLQISWLNPLNLKLGVEEHDAVHVFFYSKTEYIPSKDTKFVKNAALRINGSVKINFGRFSKSFDGIFHAWMFLTSADGKKVSNSKYLGSILIENPTMDNLSKKI